jgi:hypothetical protein
LQGLPQRCLLSRGLLPTLERHARIGARTSAGVLHSPHGGYDATRNPLATHSQPAHLRPCYCTPSTTSRPRVHLSPHLRIRAVEVFALRRLERVSGRALGRREGEASRRLGPVARPRGCRHAVRVGGAAHALQPCHLGLHGGRGQAGGRRALRHLQQLAPHLRACVPFGGVMQPQVQVMVVYVCARKARWGGRARGREDRPRPGTKPCSGLRPPARHGPALPLSTPAMTPPGGILCALRHAMHTCAVPRSGTRVSRHVSAWLHAGALLGTARWRRMPSLTCCWRLLQLHAQSLALSLLQVRG